MFLNQTLLALQTAYLMDQSALLTAPVMSFTMKTKIIKCTTERCASLFYTGMLARLTVQGSRFSDYLSSVILMTSIPDPIAVFMPSFGPMSFSKMRVKEVLIENTNLLRYGESVWFSDPEGELEIKSVVWDRNRGGCSMGVLQSVCRRTLIRQNVVRNHISSIKGCIINAVCRQTGQIQQSNIFGSSGASLDLIKVIKGSIEMQDINATHNKLRNKDSFIISLSQNEAILSRCQIMANDVSYILSLHTITRSVSILSSSFEKNTFNAFALINGEEFTLPKILNYKGNWKMPIQLANCILPTD